MDLRLKCHLTHSGPTSPKDMRVLLICSCFATFLLRCWPFGHFPSLHIWTRDAPLCLSAITFALLSACLIVVAPSITLLLLFNQHQCVRFDPAMLVSVALGFHSLSSSFEYGVPQAAPLRGHRAPRWRGSRQPAYPRQQLYAINANTSLHVDIHVS